MTSNHSEAELAEFMQKAVRHVTDEAHDPRDRFVLYRLCDCPTCGGSGKDSGWSSASDGMPIHENVRKCSDCRGEGKIRQELATCETPEAVGVVLVTLAREGEWENCPLGLLDHEGEKGKKWLILPWLPSPRNVSDAGKLLRSRRR